MKVNIIRSSLVYGPNMKGNLKDLSAAINTGWFPKLTKVTNKRSVNYINYQLPVFSIDNQGSCGGKLSPSWSISIDILSGDLTNAI